MAAKVAVHVYSCVCAALALGLANVLRAEKKLAVQVALRNEKEPDTYLAVKEVLLGFVMTLEVGLT